MSRIDAAAGGIDDDADMAEFADGALRLKGSGLAGKGIDGGQGREPAGMRRRQLGQIVVVPADLVMIDRAANAADALDRRTEQIERHAGLGALAQEGFWRGQLRHPRRLPGGVAGVGGDGPRRAPPWRPDVDVEVDDGQRAVGRVLGHDHSFIIGVVQTATRARPASEARSGERAPFSAKSPT